MGAEDVGWRVCELSSDEEDAADGSCGIEGKGDGRTVPGSGREQRGAAVRVVREEDVEPEGAGGGGNHG